jgi:hypothetical protein
LIVTSNKPFGRWGEVFGDEVVAAAMIDRLVHHAEVVSLRGDSYRLKDRDLGRTPTVSKCSGPYHAATWSGSVHALNTCSRGASKMRVIKTC